MSASFVLVLESEKTNEKLEMVYLSTTPCRELMSDYGLPYTEDYLPFRDYEFECFEKAVDEFATAKVKYKAEMDEAKEMALKAVAPDAFMERYERAKEMYEWAVEEYDRWAYYLSEVRFARGIAADNKGWALKYYSC